jgi:threonylcarbamoyladenosine tRNA methylthiotransferase MtaB
MHAGQPRVSLHTIGCRVNQAETALLADRLKRDGYRLVEFGQPTDLFVLNTCSVTAQAEAQCRYFVRRTLHRSPGAFVAVTGCYAQTGAEALRRLPGIDLIVGGQYKMSLPDYLPAPSALEKRPLPRVLHTRTIDRDEFIHAGTGEAGTIRANLKVQDGCSFMCSFCIIPFARGHERSRQFEDVLREAGELVARGHRELILTGVNIGRYACGGHSLLDLIKSLEQIEGLERIRMSSIEPTTIPAGLLEHMAESRKLCRHLHIPLQSGDDRILEAMNRRYGSRDYRRLIEEAVRLIPDVGIGTDLMVGFPGEGEEEFNATLALAAELPFSYFHVFSYSERPGTAAGRLGKMPPQAAVRTRSHRLAELSRAKRLSFYQTWIGRTVRVLFENPDAGGLWTGWTESYVRVGVPSRQDLTNRILPVLVTGVMDGLAVGRLGEC